MSPFQRLAVALLFPSALSACAYVRDRGADLAQVVDLSMGYSEGLEVNLRVTKLLQIGVGGYRGVYWAGLVEGTFDVWQEERSEFGVGPLYVHEVFRGDGRRVLDLRYPLFGDPGFREYALDLVHLSDRGLFDVGVTVNLALLGLNAAFSPVEALDFVAGVVGLDPLSDDAYGPSTDDLRRRLRSENARVRAAAVRALRRRFGVSFGYPLYSVPGEFPRSQMRAVERWEAFIGRSEVPAEESTPPRAGAAPPPASAADPPAPSSGTTPRPR